MEVDDPSGWRTLKFSIFSNLGLFFVKGVLALTCGNAVLYASTLYSLSNSVNNVFSLLGFKMSSRPADTNHPFGYGKEMFFWSFIASVFMLGFAGTGAISQGYARIVEQQAIVSVSIWPVFVLAIALVYECFLFENILRRKRYSNPIDKMLVMQSAATVIGTMVSLAAMLITKRTGSYLFDGIASILVGMILGVMALVLAYHLKEMIIGRSCNQATVQLIGNLAMKVPGVTDIGNIKTMYMGSQSLLVNMNIQVNCELNVDEVGGVVNEIEKLIKTELYTVKHINIETTADDNLQGWKRKTFSFGMPKVICEPV